LGTWCNARRDRIVAVKEALTPEGFAQEGQGHADACTATNLATEIEAREEEGKKNIEEKEQFDLSIKGNAFRWELEWRGKATQNQIVQTHSTYDPLDDGSATNRPYLHTYRLEGLFWLWPAVSGAPSKH